MQAKEATMKFTTTFRVKDSDGKYAYVFWIEDSFDPATYLVRGDSFEDAYEWFVCDERAERHLRVEDDPWIADYIDGWHGPVRATMDDLWSAYVDGAAPSVTCNDNGTPIVTESVKGMTAEAYGRRQAAGMRSLDAAW
jgi:hypothetical protein